MAYLIVHCPRIDHRPVLLEACRWRYQDKAHECKGCREWSKASKGVKYGKLRKVAWPWERKEE